jgi:hypothetical protein
MGYQYALHQHRKKLRKEKDELRRSQENYSMSSGAYWDEYSDESQSSRERHRDPKHNRRTTAWAREESRAKSISKHPSDNEEDFVQETPEAALVAAQAYLLTTQPEPGDPREHMHQAAIRSLGLVEDKLRKHPPSSIFSGAVAGEKEDFCKGSLSLPIFYFVIVLLTLLLLASFYQKYKKISSFDSLHSVTFTFSSLCCSLSMPWRTLQ